MPGLSWTHGQLQADEMGRSCALTFNFYAGLVTGSLFLLGGRRANISCELHPTPVKQAPQNANPQYRLPQIASHVPHNNT